MTTAISRLRAALTKKRHSEPWARATEPELFIIPPFLRGFITVVMAGLFGVTLYNLLSIPGGIVQWIAVLLAETGNGAPFEQVYAAFGLAVLTMLYMFLLMLYNILGHADEDDVITMIGNIDANLQERLVELENSITERLDKIERNQ